MNEAENNAYNEGFEAQDNGALKNENPYTLKTSFMIYGKWDGRKERMPIMKRTYQESNLLRLHFSDKSNA